MNQDVAESLAYHQSHHYDDLKRQVTAATHHLGEAHVRLARLVAVPANRHHLNKANVTEMARVARLLEQMERLRNALVHRPAEHPAVRADELGS
jgi:hypothetical protein